MAALATKAESAVYPGECTANSLPVAQTNEKDTRTTLGAVSEGRRRLSTTDRKRWTASDKRQDKRKNEKTSRMEAVETRGSMTGKKGQRCCGWEMGDLCL
jgi:hypothetical protein